MPFYPQGMFKVKKKTNRKITIDLYTINMLLYEDISHVKE